MGGQKNKVGGQKNKVRGSKKNKVGGQKKKVRGLKKQGVKKTRWGVKKTRGGSKKQGGGSKKQGPRNNLAAEARVAICHQTCPAAGTFRAVVAGHTLLHVGLHLARNLQEMCGGVGRAWRHLLAVSAAL